MSPDTECRNCQKLQTQLDVARDQNRFLEANTAGLDPGPREIPTEVEIQERKPTEKASALSGVIKDELALIGFLILYVGIISTDAYYAQFGVKYQFLNLPSLHIVYRGLTVLVDAPYLLLPYLTAIVWLGFDIYATKQGWDHFVSFRNLSAYLVVGVVLIITYPLAVRAGMNQAKTDLYDETSSLPQIVRLVTTKEEFNRPDREYRLLITDASFVIVFKPLQSTDRAAVPHIKRFSKGDVYVIETTR